MRRSRQVRNRTARRVERIELFALPDEAPQLHPDDLLNLDVKSNAGRRPSDRSRVITDVRGYLRSTQRRLEMVRGSFQERHVRYAVTPTSNLSRSE